MSFLINVTLRVKSDTMEQRQSVQTGFFLVVHTASFFSFMADLIDCNEVLQKEADSCLHTSKGVD